MSETITAKVYSGSKAMTVDAMKKLLGWTTHQKKTKNCAFREPGTKLWVELKNNPSNRPLRLGLAKNYAGEHLRKQWAFNGEPIILDNKGHVQDGQHRGVGFILAEFERLSRPNYYREKYGIRGPLTMEVVVVEGIKPQVADTIDLGQKRSLGDVLFRRNEFKGDGQEVKRLSNTLAHAIRLVWLRSGGQVVSDAKKFPHSEALSFSKHHPKIKDCVEYIENENGGRGAEGQKISALMSLGYAAGLMYLMGSSRTKDWPEKEPTFGAMAKAEEFWTLFASGAGMEAGHPVLTLRNQLPKVDASGAKGRDILCGMVAKAWNAFVDGETLSAKEIKIKQRKGDDERMYLAEEPRMGGLDVAVEEDVVRTVDGWREGDLVWVYMEDGNHWYGEVKSFVDMETVNVYSKTDKEEYAVKVEDLRNEKPAEEEEEEEAEPEGEDAGSVAEVKEEPAETAA